MKDLNTSCSLNDYEIRLNLPTDLVRLVPEDGDTEAAFSVDEADDPLLDTWSFLLIVRTGRIFTAHVFNLMMVCDMNEYRRILGVSSK